MVCGAAQSTAGAVQSNASELPDVRQIPVVSAATPSTLGRGEALALGDDPEPPPDPPPALTPPARTIAPSTAATMRQRRSSIPRRRLAVMGVDRRRLIWADLRGLVLRPAGRPQLARGAHGV